MKRYVLTILFCFFIVVGVAWATSWQDYGELAETGIADSDDFLVRDISDTTLGPSGTQKRYKWISMLTRTISPSDDTWQGYRISITAGETLTHWDLLYAKNSSGNLRWYKYDADGADKYRAPRAIALSNITSGATGYVGIGEGIARNDGWAQTTNQDEGKDVYASETAGALTLTAPVVTGSQVARVGYVLEENKIMFSLGNVTLVEVQ